MMRNQPTDRKTKPIDDKLHVHAWTPKGFLLAGHMDLDEDGEQMSATFAYDAAYIETPGAYPLDPVNLPFGKTLYSTQSQFVRLGSIFDAAPDAWGRKVVSAQLPETARQRVFRGAFLRGADGIGSLVITPASLAGELALNEIVQLSLTERPGLTQVARAANAARDFEAGEELSPEMANMLGGSWTIGGARPKSILRDDRTNAIAGLSFIAKFDSKHDKINRNRLESASLSMAKAVGLNVKRHHLIDLQDRGNEGIDASRANAASGGASALLLERFDRVVNLDQVHRLHYLSAMSLASHQPQSKFLDSRLDQAILSWSKLLDLAGRISDKPAQAKTEMFARLCFNAALQNTDDHLKNFGFLKTPGSATRYELAPVFDVSPQGASRHYLHLLDMGQTYTLEMAIANARRLGISAAAASLVEDSIVQVVRQCERYFDEAGLAAADRDQAKSWVDSGMGHKYVQRHKAAGQRPA